MVEGPLWTVVLIPIALGAFALAAAGLATRLREPAAGVSAPLRDAARMLVQQPRRVPGDDVLLLRLGLLGLPVAAALMALVTPVGGYVVSNSSIGVVVFNLADVFVWVGLWMIGWGANSVFGLVGGYRFLVQALAYELPHMFALTAVATGARSLDVGDVVGAQDGLWFVVWMPVAFVAYLVAALGLSAWGPFGAARSRDIAGGIGAELAGVDQLMLRGGRLLLLTATTAMAVPLFLGGGAGPLLPAWLWSLLKMAVLLGGLIWLGGRGPTVRMERFTEQAWLWLLPATLVQAAVVAVVVL